MLKLCCFCLVVLLCIGGLNALCTQSNCTLASYLTNLNSELQDLTCLETKLANALIILNATSVNSTSLLSVVSVRSKQLAKLRSAKSLIQLEMNAIQQSIYIPPIISIVENSSGRLYGNGEFAESCREYRYPTSSTYMYNNEGSGYYQIKPISTMQVVKVYCDMDSDGGGWTVIGNWANADKQIVGIADLTSNFWGVNSLPKHNQTLVHIFNNVKHYGLIFDYEIPANAYTTASLSKGHSKAIFDASGVISCDGGYVNGIYYYPNGAVLVFLCEPMFGVGVNQACQSGGPLALHLTNEEGGEHIGNPSFYTPPNIAYRCGGSTNVGSQFRILVR